MGRRDTADAMIATRITALAALIAVAVNVIAASARADEDAATFDPVTGFRIAHYRAPVPPTVPGGTRIDLDKTDELLKSGAVLIDVMPSEGAGPDPKTGAWRLSHQHATIPGATWLPDVGRGTITPQMDAYLLDNLTRLTAGDKAKPLILFCQADCWMAWNAVQRVAKLGYTQIYWFAEGTDGWVEWGDRHLTPIDPEPVRAQR